MLLKYDPGKEDESEEGEEVEEWDEDEDDTGSLIDIQYSLFEELLDVNEARSWASYGPIQHNLPVPGLHLGQDGVDALVGLPLSSTDASRNNQHASQCGLESNPSVGDNDLSCNLDPSQFELRNPIWQAAATMLGMEVTKPFDMGPATVQLRRLTLSGPSRPLRLL